MVRINLLSKPGFVYLIFFFVVVLSEGVGERVTSAVDLIDDSLVDTCFWLKL